MVAQRKHEQIYPRPGWVEHDPNEIWRRTHEVISDAMAQQGSPPACRTRVAAAHPGVAGDRKLWFLAYLVRANKIWFRLSCDDSPAQERMHRIPPARLLPREVAKRVFAFERFGVIARMSRLRTVWHARH